MNSYNKPFILFSLLFLFSGGQAQTQMVEEPDSNSIMASTQTSALPEKPFFVPPFDFPIAFSGNFGELRSNHFHGGLDFKTGGVIGKPVRALADGYISRIRVTHGSGFVLDLVYANGYSSINRHLEGFTGEIARRVERLQYEKESWEVEIVPRPDEYPVKAGEQIAWSGNTGYSFGPHLHLDMYETSTGDFIDPLPFFKDKVNDTTAPRVQGIMFFPQPGKGVVNESQSRQTFPVRLSKPITAWGLIGVGIRANDYMNGVGNHYGVHTVILEVDDKEVFRSVVDRFSQEENRLINSWTSGAYMKSFIDPGNMLRMLHASNGNRGLIQINEERPYVFVYTLSDALGNTSKYRFTVQGKQTEIAPVEHREKYAFRWDKVNYLQEPGMELVVPRGMLYDDAWLNYSVRADSGAIAFTYQLNDTYIPLQSGCELRIGLRRKPVEDLKKYYVAGVSSRGGNYYAGGKYEDGFMKTRINSLGTYTVAIDTVPPTITPINPRMWGRNGRIVLKAKDKETGIRHYRGTIDGKYALFGIPNSINGNLVYEIDPNRVKRGAKHELEMTATDICGNTTVYKTVFIW